MATENQKIKEYCPSRDKIKKVKNLSQKCMDSIVEMTKNGNDHEKNVLAAPKQLTNEGIVWSAEKKVVLKS